MVPVSSYRAEFSANMHICLHKQSFESYFYKRVDSLHLTTNLLFKVTNLKKSNISQQRQNSSGDVLAAKHINNQAMLTSVLNMLGGGGFSLEE